MLLPKKVKHRKCHKLRRLNKGVATRTNTIAFGSYGLVATTHSWVTSRQIESARRVVTRYIKRAGKMWIRVFPDRPVTRKGSEMPMGKGKGAPDHFMVTVKPGTVLFELEGIPEATAKEAFDLAAYKLPVKARFIKKD
ncbi:MAG: 50S ribosomal protein L16 [Candidatus Magasanikbacteria bacterium]|nr:50S ribosomal protein L16 [Candidatus Magasanikbacteria bacterium]|tara:strand:+ start:27 stop:440 length:414 start_codon:yes stop_codon:yes gene_type:complete